MQSLLHNFPQRTSQHVLSLSVFRFLKCQLPSLFATDLCSGLFLPSQLGIWSCLPPPPRLGLLCLCLVDLELLLRTLSWHKPLMQVVPKTPGLVQFEITFGTLHSSIQTASLIPSLCTSPLSTYSQHSSNLSSYLSADAFIFFKQFP